MSLLETCSRTATIKIFIKTKLLTNPAIPILTLKFQTTGGREKGSHENIRTSPKRGWQLGSPD